MKKDAQGVTFGRIAMETLSPCNPVKAIPPPLKVVVGFCRHYPSSLRLVSPRPPRCYPPLFDAWQQAGIRPWNGRAAPQLS